ncbi:MAG: DUF6029 family protein [Bacteroidota bacterium]
MPVAAPAETAAIPAAQSANPAQTPAPSLLDEIHGDFQTDAARYYYDPKINTPRYPEKLGCNSYLNLIYTKGPFTLGGRYELYQPVLQGFDSRYKGSGFPYRFINYKSELIDITVGNIYEQFGSGMIFRTYQEWGLGFDNSLDGVRVRARLLPGLRVKALIGKQRLYFDHAQGIVRGADAELNLNEAVQNLKESDTHIILGTGVVSKFQADNSPVYNLPENVSKSSWSPITC